MTKSRKARYALSSSDMQRMQSLDRRSTRPASIYAEAAHFVQETTNAGLSVATYRLPPEAAVLGRKSQTHWLYAFWDYPSSMQDTQNDQTQKALDALDANMPAIHGETLEAPAVYGAASGG